MLPREKQRAQTCPCPKGKVAQGDKRLFCQMAWQAVEVALLLPLADFGFHVTTPQHSQQGTATH